MTATVPQVKAAIDTVAAFAETIRNLASGPSGHLYATVCGAVTMDQYQAALAILSGAGLIEVKSDLITWIGPHFAPTVSVSSPEASR